MKSYFNQIYKIIFLLLLTNSSNLYAHNLFNGGCKEHCGQKVKVTSKNYKSLGLTKADIGSLGVDKNHYIRPLIGQKYTYDKKIAAWKKQFPGWVGKFKKKQVEAFLIKYITQIHPESWKLLGLPDINSELVKRLEENLKPRPSYK